VSLRTSFSIYNRAQSKQCPFPKHNYFNIHTSL
jgi:hypothetical protein